MTAVPDKGTCQLEQTKVIGCLLVVANQYRPALGQPAQGAFHHPPPYWVGLPARLVQFLFANTPNMRLASGLGDCSVAGGVVIPLVQTLVLGAFRPVHHYALQRWPEEIRVVDIGSDHHHAQWSAGPVDQDAFLASCLPTVCGIASDSAPQNAPFPWSSRLIAIPSLRRPSPGIPLSGRPRYPQSPQLDPTLEGPVDGAVIPQLLGQAVPLAGATHPEDDAFQHLALVHPFAPLPVGWVQLRNHWLNSLPLIIWQFPDRGQVLALSHPLLPHRFLQSKSHRLWILPLRPIPF